MKKKILFGGLIFVFISCNSEKAENITTTATTADSLPAKEKQLKEDIKKYPDSMLLKESLIQYYDENADYDNAIKELNNAIAKDSMADRYFDKRAVIHLKDNDTTASIKDLEHAIRIKAEPIYVISLGTLYAQTRNPLALEIADELGASKARAEKEAFFIKGLYYSFTNEKLKAIAFFDKCLAISYTFMDAYIEKSIALYDLGKYEDALDVLDKALTVQNNYDEAYYYAGRCLEKLKRIEEAIISYQNAITIYPDYIEAKEALARLGVKS
jgi:tetratricopeptide (TPR) repeat protein